MDIHENQQKIERKTKDIFVITVDVCLSKKKSQKYGKKGKCCTCSGGHVTTSFHHSKL